MTFDLGSELVGGVITGLVVVIGVVAAEAFTRARERSARRERLLTDLRVALPRFRELVKPGGILAVSPGSAQGHEAALDAVHVLGLVGDLLTTVRQPLFGWRKNFQQECLDLAAWAYIAMTSAAGNPLSPGELERLNVEKLEKFVYGKPLDRGFPEALRRAEDERSTRQRAGGIT